ncbi:restriction endonuclease [Xanthomonas nasturtii]|uniref:restriction endonuclease n=1 Tax=Xanthomonas nasturtii TaxID=1843581 RepID=UPI002013156E|nr:restriction endonuclease [Xanthomonas nasturtii]MCL1570034.1 restriction endonuclease [Xanthomonas nasturtii]MCL1573961.1 restriction endonuclease [Xanthomonas nasturtii]MCL1581580.1 restriction endonuclease [Xanthomonas nasturtii]MCL1585506.1 restriction endonuclease [Xanthomonas nasturtii]MCL1591401.1 restriction endonuclease [Xanthomonas nasturtii]
MLMPSWILAPLVALLLWLAVCAYFWLVRRRADEVHEGVRALAAMHWRDFSAVVLRVLQDQRGWQPTQLPQDGLPTADFMMQTEHGTRLVACKHGRGYRIGVAAVNELGAMARLAGANGGVMVTEGRMEREGVAAAEKQSIEVLDGARLWPLLKPYLPGDVETGVVGTAKRRAIRHSVIAGAALATLALVAVLALRPPVPAPAAPRTALSSPTTAPARVAASTTAPATASQPPAAAASTPAAAAPAAAGAEPDAATLQGYQREVSKALAQTPGLIRGIWLTQATLAVDRTVEDSAAWPLICRELERYPYLRTVRVQLNPRPGIAEPVRWRQCTTI